MGCQRALALGKEFSEFLDFPIVQSQGGCPNSLVDVFLHCVSRSVSEVCFGKKKVPLC